MQEEKKQLIFCLTGLLILNTGDMIQQELRLMLTAKWNCIKQKASFKILKTLLRRIIPKYPNQLSVSGISAGQHTARLLLLTPTRTPAIAAKLQLFITELLKTLKNSVKNLKNRAALSAHKLILKLLHTLLRQSLHKLMTLLKQ